MGKGISPLMKRLVGYCSVAPSGLTIAQVVGVEWLMMPNASPAERNDRACHVERALNRLCKRGLLRLEESYKLVNEEKYPLNCVPRARRDRWRMGKRYHAVTR
jgi:hypothetical protein